jgi:tol-pal system beta propeller repeat protein TolB
MIRFYARTMQALLAFVFIVTLVAAATPARSELRIDITRGVVEPVAIAIVPFEGSGDNARIGGEIAKVVSNDLQGSGLFRPIDPNAFLQANLSMDAAPKFADWRVLNALALVQGRVSVADDGRLKVEFRLWDVVSEQQLAGLAYFAAPGNWRRIAHIIADAIYKRLTGEDGYFDTRIAYIAESGPQTRRVKKLAIMDQDGFNNRYLTDGSSLVLTPRFSPTLQELTYLSFVDGQPRILIHSLEDGRTETVGNFPGMTFSPRFSPDSQKLIFSMALDGNTDIYTIDLKSKATRRLTNNSAIDTSPSYSPDGRQIVFNSDRGGSQQLYVMDADGGEARRISFGQGKYGTPVWSPRGDLIAFTKIAGSGFAIGVMAPDGSGERIVAEGHDVEEPTWAPNGRVLAFFRKEPVDAAGGGGRSRLYAVNLTGRNEREIPTSGDASDPAWSPLQP